MKMANTQASGTGLKRNHSRNNYGSVNITSLSYRDTKPPHQTQLRPDIQASKASLPHSARHPTNLCPPSLPNTSRPVLGSASQSLRHSSKRLSTSGFVTDSQSHQSNRNDGSNENSDVTYKNMGGIRTSHWSDNLHSNIFEHTPLGNNGVHDKNPSPNMLSTTPSPPYNTEYTTPIVKISPVILRAQEPGTTAFIEQHSKDDGSYAKNYEQGKKEINVVGLQGSKWANPENQAKELAKPLSQFFGAQDRADEEYIRRVNASGLTQQRSTTPASISAGKSLHTFKKKARNRSQPTIPEDNESSDRSGPVPRFLPSSLEQINAEMHKSKPQKLANSISNKPEPFQSFLAPASTSTLQCPDISAPTFPRVRGSSVIQNSMSYGLAVVTSQAAASHINQQAHTPPLLRYDPLWSHQWDVVRPRGASDATRVFSDSIPDTTRPEHTDLVARRMIAADLGIKIPQKTDDKTVAIARALKNRATGGNPSRSTVNEIMKRFKNTENGIENVEQTKEDKTENIKEETQRGVSNKAIAKERMDNFYAMMKSGKA